MKGKRNVWAVFLGIAVAAMSAAGCGAGESSGQGPEKVSEEKRLTVYTSHKQEVYACLLYTSPSPRDVEESRMPSSA